MSKRLAIKGHPTRGNEVIEILEMMGGKNNCDSPADNLGLCYLIDDEFDICAHYFGYDDYEDGELNIFTLEEFLEKYPFKVDDIIKFPNNMAEEIAKMKWDEELEDIIYTSVSGWTRPCHVPKNIKNKTNMNENKCIQCVYAVNNNHCGLRGFRSNFNVNYCSAQNVDKLPNGFELQEDGYFSWVNKKPKYPTTYEECWKVRFEVDGETILEEFHHVSGYYSETLGALQKLLCCRDAYWKIAGEEMGLGKPWKPDLENEELYCIQNYNKQITISRTNTAFNKILIFPTEEMRDAFYENFKDLIESCKELL